MNTKTDFRTQRTQKFRRGRRRTSMKNFFLALLCPLRNLRVLCVR